MRFGRVASAESGVSLTACPRFLDRLGDLRRFAAGVAGAEAAGGGSGVPASDRPLVLLLLADLRRFVETGAAALAEGTSAWETAGPPTVAARALVAGRPGRSCAGSFVFATVGAASVELVA